MSKIIKTETARHREAFEFYYGLGQERSLAKVATQYGVSEQAVADWSGSFGWQARIVEREAHVAAQLSERVARQEVDRRAQNLKILDALKAKFVQKLRMNEIKIESVRDIEVILRLEAEILAEGEGGAEENNPLVKLARQIEQARAAKESAS